MSVAEIAVFALSLGTLPAALWFVSREWPEERLARQWQVLSRLMSEDVDEWLPLFRLREGTNLELRRLVRTAEELATAGVVELVQVGPTRVDAPGALPQTSHPERRLIARVTPTFRASPKWPPPPSAVGLR